MVQANHEAIEKRADTLVSALCIEQRSETDRSKLLADIQLARKEDPTILTTISAKLRELDKGPQRAIANENLKSLHTRISVIKDVPEAGDVESLRCELESIQREIETADQMPSEKSPTMPRIPEPVPAPVGRAPTPIDQQPQTAPETWLPRTADPREWTGKQIATLSAITAGGVGLYALWKWMRGAKKNSAGGEKRSKWNWMLWLPFAGLAGYVGYKAWNAYGPSDKKLNDQGQKKNDRDYLPHFIPKKFREPVNAVIGGVDKGTDAAANTFGPAAYELMNHEHTREVLRKKEAGEYSSSTAYRAALVGAMTLDGMDLVWDEGSITLSVLGKLVECNTEFWREIVDGSADGQFDLGEKSDIVATLVEGSFVYATSLLALKAVTLNRMARGTSIARVAGESLLWPIYSIKRGAQGTWAVTKGTFQLLDADSATRITIAREADALRFQTKLAPGTFLRRFREATPEGLLMRKEFIMDQANRLTLARGKNLPEASIQKFEEMLNKSMVDFQTYMRRIPPNQLPQWYIDAVKFRYPTIDPSKIQFTHMEGLMRHFGDGNATAEVAKSLNSAEASAKAADQLVDVSAISKVAPQPPPLPTNHAAANGPAADLPQTSPKPPPLPKSRAKAGALAGDASAVPKVTSEPPPLFKAAGGESLSVPEPAAKPATAPSVAAEAKPEFKVVRRDGTRVSAETGDAIEEGDAVAHVGKAGARAETGVAKVAGAAHEASAALDTRTAAKLDTLVQSKSFATLLEKSGRTADEARQILGHVEGLSPDILARIEMSPKAQKMLAGALEVKGIATAEQEAAHVINLANRARAWRLGFNAFGAAADMFGIVMAGVDMWENKERIKNTQNPALKEIYANAYYVYAGQMGTSAIGLAYAGVFMVQAAQAGAGLVTALSAPAGAVMLPVGIAAFAAVETYKSLEKSAEYHTLTEKDMVRDFTPGKIQQHIHASTSIQNVTWTQNLVLPRETALDANRGARWEGYRAYFAQLVPSYIPQAGSQDISQNSPADTQSSGASEQQLRGVLEKQKQAVDKENAERRSFFVNAAIAFVEDRTHGTFDPISDSKVLEEACLFAQMRFGDKYVRKEHATFTEADARLDGYCRERTKERYEYLVSQSKENPDAYAREVGPMLLEQVRHDLALFDMRLLDADFSNFSTSAAWNLSKWYGDNDMRCAARGYITQELWNMIQPLTQNGVTPERLRNAVKAMRTLLNKDPDVIAREAIRSDRHKEYFEQGRNPQRMSIPGMAEFLNEHRLVKPIEASFAKSDPLPLENLKFHYADRIGGHMPIQLKIPGGAEEGYISVHEDLWMRRGSTGECTKVGEKDAIKSIALSPGLYQFWNESSMPYVREGQPAVPSSMPGYSQQMSNMRIRVLTKPNKRPDFEISLDRNSMNRSAA